MFNFVVDRLIKGRPYPNLAQHPAEPYTPAWREFGQYSPYTVPLELINHCEQHGYPFELVTTGEYIHSKDTRQHWYPIQFGFFSFELDYILLLPPEVRLLLADTAYNLRILFYYHEGDNPERIKHRLDYLCEQNKIPKNSYRSVSGNTAADAIENSIHFNDHELLYYLRNKSHEKFFKTGALRRDARFLCLTRTHKWWRATVVADLVRAGLLDGSLWSYNTLITVDDSYDNNPIEVDTLALRDDLTAFVNAGPYRCDDLDSTQHNDHSLHSPELFDSTYCSIILETLFDADGSGGAFLTEKTFKCLKHGHPFIIVGAAGSLAALRSLGYRTFDHVIDNSYDLISDNTLRYLAVRSTIAQIAALSPAELDEWLAACRADLEHNSRLFLASKWDRLNRLQERLNHGK